VASSAEAATLEASFTQRSPATAHSTRPCGRQALRGAAPRLALARSPALRTDPALSCIAQSRTWRGYRLCPPRSAAQPAHAPGLGDAPHRPSLSLTRSLTLDLASLRPLSVPYIHRICRTRNSSEHICSTPRISIQRFSTLGSSDAFAMGCVSSDCQRRAIGSRCVQNEQSLNVGRLGRRWEAQLRSSGPPEALLGAAHKPSLVRASAASERVKRLHREL